MFSAAKGGRQLKIHFQRGERGDSSFLYFQFAEEGEILLRVCVFEGRKRGTQGYFPFFYRRCVHDFLWEMNKDLPWKSKEEEEEGIFSPVSVVHLLVRLAATGHKVWFELVLRRWKNISKRKTPWFSRPLQEKNNRWKKNRRTCLSKLGRG